ncbi:MAG: bacteriohemerythrin [Deltaproteobacteria bacterium]|nr:MAG: bacteriohemerythrin [Deltaproteobacteria bacterium]
MALTWTEDLTVGYGLIDAQHRELFARYNSLLQACRDGKGREAIEPVLDFLVEYVTVHFAEEERFMERYAFPERDEHIRQHRDLFRQVDEVRRELRERGASVAVTTSISHSLLNWLLRHVKQTDVKLGRFLAAKAA